MWCAENEKSLTGRNTVFFADVDTTTFIRDPRDPSRRLGDSQVMTVTCTGLATSQPLSRGGVCHQERRGAWCHPGPFDAVTGHLFSQDLSCSREKVSVLNV